MVCLHREWLVNTEATWPSPHPFDFRNLIRWKNKHHEIIEVGFVNDSWVQLDLEAKNENVRKGFMRKYKYD